MTILTSSNFDFDFELNFNESPSLKLKTIINSGSYDIPSDGNFKENRVEKYTEIMFRKQESHFLTPHSS